MIKQINGQWHQEITRPDGTKEFILMGGATDNAQQEAYFDERAAFASENYWNPSKDYTSGFDSLFGGVKDAYNYTPSFGSGPNQSWQAALRGRLEKRAGGDLTGRSQFEARTGTTAYDYQERMYARNNAIEEMYRQGYDMSQIADHVEGRVNINTVDPSYKDYMTTREQYGDNAADYFKVPDNVEEILGDRRREGIQSAYQTMVNNVKSLFNDPRFRQALGNYSASAAEPEPERKKPTRNLRVTNGLFGDRI